MDTEALKNYVETDEGKAWLETLKAPLIEKRTELLEEVRNLKEKTKTYEALGDAATIKTILSEYEQNKSKAAETEQETHRKNGNFEALEKNLRDELTKREQKIELFKNKAIQAKVDADLKSAIAEAKGSTELLLPILKARVKGSFNEEGELVIEVVDPDGKAMYEGGNAASVKDLVTSVKNNEIYGRAFEGTGASGSGTRSSSAKANGIELDPKKPGYSLTAAMEYYKKNPNLIKKS